MRIRKDSFKDDRKKKIDPSRTLGGSSGVRGKASALFSFHLRGRNVQGSPQTASVQCWSLAGRIGTKPGPFWDGIQRKNKKTGQNLKTDRQVTLVLVA